MTAANTSSIAPERLEAIRELLMGTPFKDGELRPLAGDASFRRYIRVGKGAQTAMLMDAPPGKEDVRPFVATSEFLVKEGSRRSRHSCSQCSSPGCCLPGRSGR